jgi:7-cyano-7-deazaguanine synthase
VLLSGGLDSYTAAAIVKADGFELYALSVWYGQRHAREIDAARAVAAALGVVRHLELAVDLRAIGGSSLTGDRDRTPRSRPWRRPRFRPPTFQRATQSSCRCAWDGPKWSAPPIWSSASMRSTTLDIPTVVPSSFVPLKSWRRWRRGLAVEGTSFKIHTPLISMSKAAIIRRGLQLGLDYSITHSCYDPDVRGRPCGRCDSCRLRARGFAEAGVPDPVLR